MKLKAVILAAGLGSRLRPSTDSLPKCLLEVRGKPIIINTLEDLNRNGIQRTIIVVGYLAKKVTSFLGNRFGNIKLSYVKNNAYDKTNNIYSLWLARNLLRGATILIEGDIFFRGDIIKKILRDYHENLIVVDQFREGMSGTVVSIGQNLRVAGMTLKKDQDENHDFSNSFKTVNVYKFSKEFMTKHFIPTLDAYVQRKQVNEFYEIAIRDIIREDSAPLYASLVNQEWFDVDTVDDMNKANENRGVF